jgi:hypothetical protein
MTYRDAEGSPRHFAPGAQARARAERAAAEAGRVERAWQRDQEWPAYPESFMKEWASAKEAVQHTEIDFDKEEEAAFRANREIEDQHLRERAPTPEVRRDLSILQDRVARAEGAIVAYRAALARLDRCDKYAERFDLASDGSGGISLEMVEAEIGPDDGSMKWQEQATRRLEKARRRERADYGPARGYQLPGPPEPPAGTWRSEA